MGQEERFPAPRLAARYVIRQETLAGDSGNGREAPISVIHGTFDRRYTVMIGPSKSRATVRSVALVRRRDAKRAGQFKETKCTGNMLVEVSMRL